MGIFRHEIEVAPNPSGPFTAIEALVDTGASYTWLPASLLRQMGASPAWKMPFVMADGREVEKEMTTIYVRVDGRERYTPCIFGDEGTNALLGVVTLEELGLGVDPINRKLLPVPGILALMRHRLVPASEPDADPACRLTREEGQRRGADIDRLFSLLAEQRQTPNGNEFVFRGDPRSLWDEVSLFVDQESRCCPFFTFEQVEEADGVLLRMSAPGRPE